MVDRDDDDCRALKERLESIGLTSGLRTPSRAGTRLWQLVSRIAIEELEAWYFGDWEAVSSLYPGVPATIPSKKGFRDPDAIRGGTWEAFERIMQRHGYFRTGLRQIEAARAIGGQVDRGRSRSHSFLKFCEAITQATA